MSSVYIISDNGKLSKVGETLEFRYIFETGEDESLNADNQKAIYLNENGLKKTIAAFEKKIESEILYQPLNQKMSFNRVIIEQVKHLRRVINDEENEYKGFLYK